MISGCTDATTSTPDLPVGIEAALEENRRLRAMLKRVLRSGAEKEATLQQRLIVSDSACLAAKELLAEKEGRWVALQQDLNRAHKGVDKDSEKLLVEVSAQPLGEGAFSRVVEGAIASIKQVVAVKISKPNRQENIEREADLLTFLKAQHVPHISKCIAKSRRSNEEVCLVLKMRGTTLAKAKLSFRESLFVLEKLLETLAALKKLGYYHGDIKPDNVFYYPSSKRPGEMKVILGDFGLGGKSYTQEEWKVLCASEYRAPEVFLGKVKLGWEIDIFALGCLFFEIYAGQRLFLSQSDDVRSLQQICERLGQFPAAFFDSCPAVAPYIHREGDSWQWRHSRVLVRMTKLRPLRDKLESVVRDKRDTEEVFQKMYTLLEAMLRHENRASPEELLAMLRFAPDAEAATSSTS